MKISYFVIPDLIRNLYKYLWIPACLPAGMAFAGMTVLFLLSTFYLLPSTTYAQVDIGKEYAFGNIKSLGEGIQLLVVPTFSVAGVIMILYFLVGAFKYMTSKGDKNNLESAKNMIIHAIVGFMILIFAFFIMQYLTEAFGIPDIIGK